MWPATWPETSGSRRFGTSRPWSRNCGRAAIGRAARPSRSGRRAGKLDVAVEPEPPHRILSFQPRPVAADAVVLGGDLRAADHRWSSLDEPAAARIDRRLSAVADEQRLVGMVVGIAVGGAVVYRGCFGVADLESGGTTRCSGSARSPRWSRPWRCYGWPRRERSTSTRRSNRPVGWCSNRPSRGPAAHRRGVARAHRRAAQGRAESADPAGLAAGGAGRIFERRLRAVGRRGFTAEIVAALDGSCDVVVLASKSPPEG